MGNREGYIPSESRGPEPAMTSHETVCLLNTNDVDAEVEIPRDADDSSLIHSNVPIVVQHTRLDSR